MKCEQNTSSEIYVMWTKYIIWNICNVNKIYHLKYMKCEQNISSKIYEMWTKYII